MITFLTQKNEGCALMILEKLGDNKVCMNATNQDGQT